MVCEAAKMSFSGDPLIGKQKKSVSGGWNEEKVPGAFLSERKILTRTPLRAKPYKHNEKACPFGARSRKILKFPGNPNCIDGICAK